MKGHGAKKVLFGTNYPMIKPKAAMAEIGGLQLEPETEKMFLFRSAVRAFKLESLGLES